MSWLGWTCTAVGLALMVAAVYWLGFLGGRRWESAVWERWLEQVEEENKQRKQVQPSRRGIQLRQVKFRR